MSVNYCVIIPTYNNAKTLKRVLDGVLLQTQDIIVINDGSTDDTATILKEYPNIFCIHLAKNSGKGKALRVGFKEAQKKHFQHAITIDSDGQHFPKDIPVFLSELEKSQKPLLLIGSRNMTQENVPKKSSFGNKFSNFWFWFETGISLTDTQSGFRSYPLQNIPKRFFTNKFEFEIEVIVRSAWKGVLVKNIPIQVLYDPSERVSHFRPFKDFTRISILNTVLVIIALIYIKPRDLFYSFKKKKFKDFINEEILGSKDSPKKKALSIALGVFIGLTPLWGLHTFLSISLSVLFNLNKVLTFAFSNVSFPPMIPFIVIFSIKIGSLLTGEEIPEISFENFNFAFAKTHMIQYVLGSFSLALISSVTIGFLSYLGLKYFNRKNASFIL